jgi:hypothetical protein
MNSLSMPKQIQRFPPICLAELGDLLDSDSGCAMNKSLEATIRYEIRRMAKPCPYAQSIHRHDSYVVLLTEILNLPSDFSCGTHRNVPRSIESKEFARRALSFDYAIGVKSEPVTAVQMERCGQI